MPVLKDQMQIGSSFGQLVIAAATIADFGAVILLSISFSREGAGVGAQLVLLGAFALAALLGSRARARWSRCRCSSPRCCSSAACPHCSSGH